MKPDDGKNYACGPANNITLDLRQGEPAMICRQIVHFVQGLFDRWIIVSDADPDVGWSGSRWVPLDGGVQVCNFDTRAKAAEYAIAIGFDDRRLTERRVEKGSGANRFGWQKSEIGSKDERKPNSDRRGAKK